MISAQRLKSASQITINALSDAGAWFGAGNGYVVRDNPLALAFNLMSAAFCVAARAVAEARKRGHAVPVPKRLDPYLSNPGVGMQVSGVLTGLSAAAAVPGIQMSQPETLLPPLILTLFAGANYMRGAATGMETNDPRKTLCDTGGILGSNVGVLLAAPGAPWPVYALRLTAMGAAFDKFRGCLNEPLRSITHPDGLALTATAAAAVASTGDYVVANAMWSGAIGSIMATNATGGVYQAFARAVRAVRTIPRREYPSPLPPMF